jgi:hypothetical protein
MKKLDNSNDSRFSSNRFLICLRNDFCTMKNLDKSSSKNFLIKILSSSRIVLVKSFMRDVLWRELFKINCWKFFVLIINVLITIIIKNKFIIQLNEKNFCSGSKDCVFVAFVFSLLSMTLNNDLFFVLNEIIIFRIFKVFDLNFLLCNSRSNKIFECLINWIIWFNKIDRLKKTNFFNFFRDIKMFEIWGENVSNEKLIFLLIKMHMKKSIRESKLDVFD